MPDVDETTLTQGGGINLGANPSNYGTTNSCGTKDAKGKLTITITNTYVQKDLKPVDFDCDGTAGNDPPNHTGGYDANGDTAVGILKGSTSDRGRIQFKTGGVGAGSDAKDTVTIPSSGLSDPDHHDITYEESKLVRVLPLDATLTYNGATSGDYHDPARVSATLVDPGAGNAPIQGKAIAFQIGTSSNDRCSAVTDSTGTATREITPTQAPGAYTLTASFAGDPVVKAASDSGTTFTVTREEITLTFTGPTVILAGSSTTTLSAKLTEDGANDDDADGGYYREHGQSKEVA